MAFGDSKISSYMVLSVISFIFNPLFSLISIYCASKVNKMQKQGNRKQAIFYSDMSFGFGYMAIVITVIVIVLAYAFGGFPLHTYYDRLAIINPEAASDRDQMEVMATTMETTGDMTTMVIT